MTPDPTPPEARAEWTWSLAVTKALAYTRPLKQPWRKHTPVFVLYWHLYFAPVLRGGGTSACSLEPALPVETCHPHNFIILHLPANGKLTPPVFHLAFHQALRFFPGQRLAFVVKLLTARQGDLNLGPVVLQVQAQRHDGKTLFLDRAL